MGADDLLCSRNAHDKNVLVRRAQSRIDQATLENEVGRLEQRAQWKINQPPSLKESQASLEGSSHTP